jgi:hypothetical protein
MITTVTTHTNNKRRAAPPLLIKLPGIASGHCRTAIHQVLVR